ncbi:hypothetical protein DB347_07540 [Opitutaceae bacterium EW11]|nr:hypothetical protein DB347_07540 [Opitutaceae bacterium EW11]
MTVRTDSGDLAAKGLEPPAEPAAGAPADFDQAVIPPPKPDGETSSLISSVLEATPDIVAVFELPSGAARYINRAGIRRLSPDRVPDLRRLGLSSIIGPASQDQVRGEVLPRVQVLGNWSGVVHLRDTSGAEFRLFATFLSERVLARRNLVFLHAMVPVEHINAESSIAEHELLRAILETLPDCVYFKDLSSRFIRISRAMARKFHIGDPSDAIGKTDFDFFADDHAIPAFNDEQQIIATGKPILDIEEKEVFEDGRIEWVHTCKFPFRDLQGKLIGTFGISRDITAKKKDDEERRQMEVRLQLAQKLESVGRLAAGVAHEINTPTQFVSDNARFLSTSFSELTQVLDAYHGLLQRLKSDPTYADQVAEIERVEAEVDLDYLTAEIPKTLDQSIDGLGRIGRIVGSLKEFSHPNGEGRQAANLNRAIETAVAVSRHEWKYVAEVTTELDPKLPLVPCVLDEFSQAVLNLIINAAHAIADRIKDSPETKGRITLRTRTEGEWVTVEVEDTGTGMSPEVRAHMFEPFFTTKPLGKGTGQGLAIVHSVIVKGHGGQVDCRTEPGRGSTFILRLPLIAPADTSDASGGNGRHP